AGKIELWEHDSQRAIFVRLLRMFAARPFTLEAQAPQCVEVMIFDQPTEHRLIVHLLNFQEELPNIPITGIHLKLWINGKSVRRISHLPHGQEVSCTAGGDFIEFTAPRLENYLMLAIEYLE